MKTNILQKLLWVILFGVIALGPVRIAYAGIVFQDDFAGTTIDPDEWDVSIVRQDNPGIPADQYGSYGQDEHLWFRIDYGNIARGQAITKRTFTEQDSVIEVEVWQDSISGWQDWPINMVTHLGAFGYYNYQWHWTVQWVDSQGNDQMRHDFPFIATAGIKYKMKIQLQDEILSWHLDLDDGQGYRLLHSTTDFSLSYAPSWLEPDYFERIALTSTDIGTTSYDNIVVTPEPATIALLALGTLILRRR